MKIAYLINGMFNFAGRERVVANKACFFAERGHQITIITTDQKSRHYYYSVPEETIKIDLGINNDEYAGLPIHKKVLMFLRNDKLFKKRLTSFLAQNPQDVIVTLEDRFIPALVEVASQNTILVAENHFNHFAFAEIGKSVNRNLIQRFVYTARARYVQYRYYKKLDSYVLLTHEEYEYWRGDKRNVVVIPNSINYDNNKCARLENKTVIAIGRLSYQKGFERLLDAWSIVSDNCQGWKLQIYGDGEDKPHLIKQIDRLGIKDSVTILPPTPQIESKLLESSIFVLSSRFEGLPMVLLEAMSLGLPIVSFDCKTGPKDIIMDGYNGFLVPEGDIALLSESIINLIQNPDLRKQTGYIAKKEASKYSHDYIADMWEELFNKLRNEKCNILLQR